MPDNFVAILTGPDTYLDHLAPICHIMDMPLLITEDKTYETAVHFYPQIKAVKKELYELSSDFLAAHFDVIFESGKFWSMELQPLFQLLYKKDVRFVFCPHGNSDKGHSLKKAAKQDLSLVYGDHMLDLLTRTQAIQEIQATARTGNYRLPFYLQHQPFYDNLVKNKITCNLIPNKPVLLYAPTWQDGENPSSFFTSTQKLIEQVKSSFNLIIKLHPFLEEFHPAHTYYITSRYENDPGIFFLEHFPAIYPLLQICDIYVGDYSSIGYDFLSFNRPLYFLAGPTSSESQLHPCGMVIPEKERIDLFIQKTLHQNQTEKEPLRKKLYEYAFGKERSFLEIQKEILEKLAVVHSKIGLERKT